MKRIGMALAALALLGGCGVLGGKGKKRTTPTVGQRIAVLGTEASIEVDPALAGTPVVIPAAAVNADWAQPGGNAAKSMGHVVLGNSLALAWRSDIGTGSSDKARLGAAPVVGGGKVYTIDTQGIVRAFNPDSGGLLWQTQVRGEDASSQTLFGGG